MFAARQFMRQHILESDAVTVRTNIGDQVFLRYDGADHAVVAKKLPDGTSSLPPLDQLVRGVRIAVTYSMPPVPEPLVNSLAPEIIRVDLASSAPEVYEVLVHTHFGTEEGLRRMQDALGSLGTVAGVRRLT